MQKTVFSDIGRVVAIGDLHGNYPGFYKILTETGLIDQRGHWRARNTHLVQLGDILGRGGEPGKIFSLLRRLEEEAPRLESEVHVLLGNHEAMSMSGLLMYNTMEEFHDLAVENFLQPLEAIRGSDQDSTQSGKPLPDWTPVVNEKFNRRLELLGCREFRASLSPWGKVGHWLMSHKSAVIVNGTLFVHGGLNREHGCQPLDQLNNKVRKALSNFAAPDANRDIMLMRHGPQWNRQFTLGQNPDRESELQEVLDYHQCHRMVVGHTPTSCIDPSQAGKIISLYNEKLLCIDTGIGKSYGGNLSALSLESGEASILYL